MAKKPKRPKAGASLSAWESYDKRISKWHSDKKRKESLMKKHRS